MLSTAAIVVGIIAGVYEVVVRFVPSIPLKYSWIQKIINVLVIISNTLNNKK